MSQIAVTDAMDTNTEERKSLRHPETLAAFRAAAELMAEARQAQRECGKVLKGRLNLDDQKIAAVRWIFNASALIAAATDNIPPDDALNLLLRFEEMCRRRKIAIAPALRPTLHRLLSVENAINAQALDMPPHKTLSYTLHEGAAGPDLIADPRFAKLPPWLIARAAFLNPAGSEQYLLDGITRRDALAADPRFAGLPPWVIANAAFHNPAGTKDNPQASAEKLMEKFLRGDVRIVGCKMRDGVATKISEKDADDLDLEDKAFDIADEDPDHGAAPTGLSPAPGP